MNRNIFSVALCVLLLVLCVSAHAQQPKQISRIGFMGGESARSPEVDAFRQGLRDLGYVEGKNLSLEYRFVEGMPERLRDFAAELVRLKVDVIVVSGTAATLRAKEVTKTIPIVMTNVGDPVGEGLIVSLAHPGGNITGLSTLAV